MGDVPNSSRHAHVIIEADYHMKQVSQGLATVPGVTSQIDRSLMEAEQALREKAMPAMGTSAARFWFHLAKNCPVFLADDGVVRVKNCAVVVLTEKQRCSADGTLFDSGEEDERRNPASSEVCGGGYGHRGLEVPCAPRWDGCSRAPQNCRAPKTSSS